MRARQIRGRWLVVVQVVSCGLLVIDDGCGEVRRMQCRLNHEHGRECWCELVYRMRRGEILDDIGCGVVH